MPATVTRITRINNAHEINFSLQILYEHLDHRSFYTLLRHHIQTFLSVKLSLYYELLSRVSEL